MGSYAVEQHGVDTIPDAERTSGPRDLVAILWGGNLAFSVVVFGWLAILYGLSWWGAVSAILVGTFVGSVAVTPLALLGYRSGSNNSVSSGAYFGVRGRLVASAIGLLLCLGYIALTVWTGGEAVVTAIARVMSTQASDTGYAIGFLAITLVVVVVAIYGFDWLVLLNKWIVPVVGGTMILTVVAFAGSFDASYAGTPDQYALGSFWPTWLLAALTAGVAGPISYVTLTGDWTRYISPHRHSRRSLLDGYLARDVRRAGRADPVRRLHLGRGVRSRQRGGRAWSRAARAGCWSRSSRRASSAAWVRAASTSTAWVSTWTRSCPGSAAPRPPSSSG